MKPHLVFCGMLGSGKSTVSKAVALHLGANWSGFGKIVKKMAEEQGLKIEREQLQAFGEQIVRETPEMFCEKILADASYLNGHAIVLDGLRHASILALLRQKLAPAQLLCVFVDIGEAIRVERVSKRDGLSSERLRQLDMHSTEIEVGKVLRSLSDFVVDNSHAPESAVNAVIVWLDSIGLNDTQLLCP